MQQQWDISEELEKGDRLQFLANICHSRIDDFVDMMKSAENYEEARLPLNHLLGLMWMMSDIYGYEIVKEWVDKFTGPVLKNSSKTKH